MRVSDGMRLDAVTRQVALASQMQVDASREASTGLRVGAPSDDPVAAAQAARAQAQYEATTHYRTTITNARGDIELTESTLATATDVIGSAHDLAMQAVNGSMTASERATMAAEVQHLQEQLVGLANTKGTQGYLFGGTANSTAPYSSNGTFLGNSNDRSVEVGPNVTAVVNVSGAAAFGMAGNNVFTALAALQSALTSNDPAAISASVNALDAAQRQVVVARADAGLKISRLDTADSAHEVAQTSLSTQKHNLVDADPATAYSKLMAVQSSIEQAISVARSTLATMSTNHFG